MPASRARSFAPRIVLAAHTGAGLAIQKPGEHLLGNACPWASSSRGLVTRTRGEQDRRIVWVVATESGREMLKAAPAPLQRTFSDQLEALPDWEQAMIVAALERVGAIDASPLLDVGAVDRK